MPKEAKATEKLKNYLNGAWYWKHKKDYYAEKVLRLRSKAEKMTTGISDKQTDAYMKLTSEMKKRAISNRN